MLKEEYKSKREALDSILIEMNVPKLIWHVPVELNLFIFQHRNFHPDAQKALDLIYEMSPKRITKFNILAGKSLYREVESIIEELD